MLVGLLIVSLTLVALAVDEARRPAAPRNRRARTLHRVVLLALVAASAAVILIRLHDVVDAFR